jgi:predicted lipid-binding transport protein (Tim44 family)
MWQAAADNEDSMSVEGGFNTMPGLLRSLLGFIILLATIGLATCQAMVKAAPSAPVAAFADHPARSPQAK